MEATLFDATVVNGCILALGVPGAAGARDRDLCSHQAAVNRYRAMTAMMQLKKPDIEAMQRAYDGR